MLLPHHVHHNIFHVYMVLTRQTDEIQNLLVNTVAFQFAIVQVQQWGYWKHAPM